ncbi:MAG: CubicO group peptidase (beta-lactamase class C family) [Lysobacterales bacterium]|jgi:CubicO group peptidase (beta-lactamase class C family)
MIKLSIKSILVAALLLLLASCEKMSEKDSVAVAPGVDVETLGFGIEGLEALDRYVVAKSTHSMQVTVGGQLLYSYGPQDETSYIASVRKSVLAMLYGPYVADGTIDLDATLEDIGFDDIGGLLPIEKQATIRDLISARSGIYHVASNGGDNSSDAPERGSQQPGSYYLYNNWDFNAAGAVFEKLTGRNIYEEVYRQIVVPTGMQDFDLAMHLEKAKTGNLERSHYQAYHMHFSTRDLIKVGQLMLRRGNWNGVQLFDAEWIDALVTTHTPLNEMNPESRRDGPHGYGYMWWVFDEATHGPEYKSAYAGRGHYGNYIVVLPAIDLVISHKTWPIRYESSEEYADINVTWEEMQKIIDRLLAARK